MYDSNKAETKKIDELEHIASLQASPRIPAAEGYRSISPPERKVIGSPERGGQLLAISPALPSTGRVSPDSLSSSSGMSSNDNSAVYGRYAPLSDARNKPSLAPPVDLSTKNPRRSSQASFAPPALHQKFSSGLTHSSAISRSPILSTPPAVRRPFEQPSASRKTSTAMEQDAIETLMFMSSPGNTQYKPSSQQTLPGSQPKRSALSSEVTGRADVPDTDAIPLSPRKINILDSANLGTEESIDQVLDQMPAAEEIYETSSEDEDVH